MNRWLRIGKTITDRKLAIMSLGLIYSNNELDNALIDLTFESEVPRDELMLSLYHQQDAFLT